MPSTSARPSETVSIGVSRNVPGASENVFSAPVACSSAWLNSSIGFQPTSPSTNSDITTMPAISSTALMICTHVVASMPPKMT